MVVNDELRRMYKRAAVVCFKALFNNLKGGIEENPHDVRPPSRELNPRFWCVEHEC
jgi:hypothetical protein